MKIRFFLLFFLLNSQILTWADDFSGWKSISTKHFTFIFEEFDRETAFELSGYGEEIYSLVTDYFNYRPKNISVYINSRVDSPNGNFYPIPGSIDLYPVYPLYSANTTKSRSWLYELLLHEMVHYVQLENPVGIFGGLSRVLGRDLASANGAFLPAWMVEGIAVYLESQGTEGGRGNNLYFQSIMKAAAWENDYFTINQLAYSSDYPPYDRIYSGGYVLTKYLIDTFGEDIINRIYRRYVRFPLFGPFYAIKKETGKSLKEIFEDMKEAEKYKYRRSFAEASKYKSRSLSPSAPIIGDYSHPIETERGIIAYRKEQTSPSSLVLINRETGREQVLANAILMDGSSFSADEKGERIIFSSPSIELYHSYGRALISDLYILEEGKIVKLTEGLSLSHPAISRNGKTIIAVQRSGSYSKLVGVNPETGETEKLFARNQSNIMNPQFSQDGKEIVFTLNERGYQDIWVMETGNPRSARALTGQNHSSEYYPRFTKEGNISFISDRDGDLGLYLFDRKSNTTNLIFKDPVSVADAYYSNGEVIYQSYRTNGYVLRKGMARISIDPVIWDSGTPPKAISIVKKEMKNHADFAIPYLWLPFPYFQNSVSEGILWGVGTAFFAGSVSQSTQWVMDISYLPEPGQLVGTLDYNRKIGRTTLSYNLEQSYEEIDSGAAWQQKTKQTVSLSYPLFEKMYGNTRHVMQNYFNGTYILSASEGSPFSLTDSASMAPDNYLFGGTGLTHSIYRINNAPTALFGGIRMDSRLDLSLLFPILSAEKTSLIIKESSKISIPFSQRGTLWHTAWDIAWNNRGYASSAVKARGWTSSSVPSDLSFYYTTSLQVPIALVDWGLPLGFNVQNLALALNFEGISHVLFDGLTSHQFYGSFEFIGTYGYNYGATPFGAGISFRFYRDKLVFDPAKDLQFYFFFSFDSLE